MSIAKPLNAVKTAGRTPMEENSWIKASKRVWAFGKKMLYFILNVY